MMLKNIVGLYGMNTLTMRIRVPFKTHYFRAICNLTPKFCHIFKLKICEINQFKGFCTEKCQVLIHVILMYVDNKELSELVITIANRCR